MSSINTTFQPLTGTVVVDNTAGGLVVKDAVQKGASTFRVVARVANAYLAWGRSTVTAPAAPAAVGPVAAAIGQAGVIGLTKDVACYIEVPPDSTFISSAVFATSNVEITGGIGGVGG